MPIIPALRKQRQEDLEFQLGLDYIVSSRPARDMQPAGVLKKKIMLFKWPKASHPWDDLTTKSHKIPSGQTDA
jgi:hypothetical protein